MAGSSKCPSCGADLLGLPVDDSCPGCLVALAATLPGEESLGAPEFQRVRLGDYELREEIASGGMGIVFRARQLSLNRDVAVKMIRSGQTAGTAFLRRFKTEAETAANLDHPNIVPIHEIGDFEGQSFFSMKLIEGGSLAEHIESGKWQVEEARPMDGQRRIVTLMIKVVRAVQHAHERGVLHRDLKPSNILLDEEGEPHLTDFGLAKLVERSTELTQTIAVMGTVGYMSPEQASGRSRQITISADIYSLGAVLYELLTGRPPFVGEDAMGVLKSVVESDPIRPRDLQPGIDPDLETICLKCLEKEPHRRYATAEALAQDLERWTSGQPITARKVGRGERALKWARRHRVAVRWATTAVVAFALVLSGGLWLWKAAEEATFHGRMQTLEPGAAGLVTLAEILRGDPANRVATERLLNIFMHHRFLLPTTPPVQGPVQECRWSGDGRHLLLARSDSNGTDVIVAERAGSGLIRLTTDSSDLRAAEINLDGSVVVLGVGERVEAWDTRVTPARRIFQVPTEAGAVRQLQILPARRLLVAAGTRVRILGIDRGRVITDFESRQAGVLQVAVSPGANLLAVGRADGSIDLGRLDSGVWLERIDMAHTNVIRDLDLSPDGSLLVSAGSDRRARVWDMRTLEAVDCPHSDAVYSASFSDDGLRIVTASRDGSARLWNARNGRALGAPMPHSDAVNVARFSSGSLEVVTASDDKTVRLWDAVNGEPLTAPTRFQDAVRDARVSPDGREVIAITERRTLRRLTVAPAQSAFGLTEFSEFPEHTPVSGEELAALRERHAGAVIWNELSPDGRLVVTASADQTARIWSRRSRRAVAEPLMHDATVNCARFSPDGQRVVTSTAQRMIRVWDVRTHLPLTDWLRSAEPVTNVWFNREGNLIVTDRGAAWPVAVASEKAPDWLPELAEAVVRVNDDGGWEEEPMSALLAIKTKVCSSDDDRPSATMARRLFQCGDGAGNP